MKTPAGNRTRGSAQQVGAHLTALTRSIQNDLMELADHAAELSQRLEHLQALVHTLSRTPRSEEK